MEVRGQPVPTYRRTEQCTDTAGQRGHTNQAHRTTLLVLTYLDVELPVDLFNGNKRIQQDLIALHADVTYRLLVQRPALDDG